MLLDEQVHTYSTVGRDNQAIRECIKNQEGDRCLEPLNLWRCHFGGA